MSAIFGLFSGFALLFVAIRIGGTPGAFVNLTGMLVVVFGTIAVTAISFTFRELREAPLALLRMFSQRGDSASLAANKILQLADRARKQGILDLDRNLSAAAGKPFLEKALRLIIDGHRGDEVEAIMKREAGTISARNMRSVDILRRAGDVAPAMGLIGTLIGLVQMLGNLHDPTAIGPAMAIALLTTFYGAILAHMVFLPLAARADRMSEEESLSNSVYALGAASIGRKENPRRLEMIVNALLPPEQKVSFFE